MANKTVGVNIAFSADTSKAKAQIQELQTLLNKITYSSASSTGQKGLTDEIKNASAAAKELQYHLNNAYNANTGKLDLSLLDKSLKTTKSNITDLSTSLLSAGTTGQQAFVKMAQAISQAEQPMLKINSKVKDFANTLKNAAKYQIGNIVVQGFMSSLSSAVDYAKDLNTSLNEIRIVSGKSADEMARFAEEANKLAKRLSATTLDYTKASVIYAQQGLDDEQIAARTETTLKMANVAGTSAQTVSDQMTAVWNNFYDGSKSLEYYSDVMVKLGAATASSTDEISEGVNKFAATAKTVGLSYEYATAALATVTSRTRESADTVGNAFKTLFSRIQGLNLGETLDDGTTLNKYSKALAAVGIDIKDQSGKLKEMDTILDEMGSKWGTLAEAEKMALAQTVGGARQYTQLMALLENWDYFKENLDVAYNSEGALEEQQQIYAESWDAAADRVQASIEGVYQAILNDDFFIKLNNGFANALGGLEAFIEGAGGVKTIITGIGSVILGVFANKIPDVLQTVRYNFDLLTKGSEAAYKRIQEQNEAAMKNAFAERKNDKGETYRLINPDSSAGLEVKNANDLLAAKNKLAIVSDNLTDSERAQAEVQLSLIKSSQEEIVVLQKKKEELEAQQKIIVNGFKNNKKVSLDVDYLDQIKGATEEVNEYKKLLDSFVKDSANYLDVDLTDTYGKLRSEDEILDEIIQKYKERESAGDTEVAGNATLIQATEYFSTFTKNYKAMAGLAKEETTKIGQQLLDEYIKVGGQAEKILQPITVSFNRQSEAAAGVFENYTKLKVSVGDGNLFKEENSAALTSVKNQIIAITDTIPEAMRDATGLSEALRQMNTASDQDQLETAITTIIEKLLEAKIQGKDLRDVLYSVFGARMERLDENFVALSLNEQQAAESAKGLKGLIENFKPDHVISMSEAFTSCAASLGNIATLGNSVKSVITVVNDDSINNWEKFSAVVSGTSMALTSAFSLLKNGSKTITYVKGAFTALAGAVGGVGAAIGVIAGVAAGVAVLGVAIYGLVKAIKDAKAASPEGQLESAKKNTEAMTIAAQQAEQAYQELSDTINKYGTAIDKLEDLKKGTDEFTAALLEANDAAWVLINGNDLEFGKDWWYDPETGATVISQEAKTRITKEAQEKVENANNAKIGATVFQQEKQYAVDVNNAAKQVPALDFLLGKTEIPGGPASLSNIATSIYDDLITNAEVLSEEQSNLLREYVESTLNPGDKLVWSGQGNSAYITDESGVITRNINNFDWYAQQLKSAFSEEGLLAFENYLNTKNSGQIDLDNQRFLAYQQMLSTSLANETAYQNAGAFGGEVVQKIADEFKNKDTSEYTVEDLATEWTQFIKDSNLFIDDEGNVYTDEEKTQKAEGYNNLTDEQKQNNIIAAKIGNDMENEALGILETYANLTEEQKKYADALALGDTSKFSKEEIDKLSQLSNEELTALYQSILGNSFDAFAAFGEGVQQLEYQPPQFDLSSWKSQYVALQEVIDDVAKGDSIDSDAYGQLGEEYQQYFQEQLDGTYALTIAAEEFKKIVQETEVGKLKEAVEDKKGQINDVVQAGIDNGMRKDTTYESMSKQIQYAKDQITKDATSANEWVGGSLEKSLSAGLGITQAEGQSNLNYMQQLIAAWEELVGALDESQIALGQSANSVRELDKYLEDGTIDAEDYAKALDSVVKAEAEANDIDYSDVEEYADYLSTINKNLRNQEALCKKIALAEKKQAKGADDLVDNYKDYAKVLQKAKLNSRIKETEEYSQAITSLKKDLSLLTGVDEEIFTDEFINSTEIQQALADVANGVDGATEKLKALATMEAIRISLNDEEAITALDALEAEIIAINQEDIEIGATVNNSAALEGLAQLLYDAGMTIDQIQSYFNDLGWEPELGYIEMTAGEAAANGSYTNKAVWVPDADGMGWHQEILTDIGEMGIDENTIIRVPKIGSSTFTKIDPPGSGSTKSPSSSGGGSSPKHAEKKSSGDKVRYHTLQNQLEDISAEYDAIAEAANRAFGKDKLKNIDAEIEKTDELIDKQQEYLDAIAADLPVDKAVMDAYYQDVIGGPAIEYDERGNIANYDAIQDAMFAKYNAMADAYDEDSTEWQVFEKKYEQLEKYIEQYEETYDLLRDEEQEYQDLLNQRIDLQLEKVQYTVELKLNVSEDQVKLLEYQLGKVEDDGFKSLEAIGLLTAKAGELNNQIQANKQGLNDALKLSLSAAEISEVMAGNMDVLNGKNFTEDQIDAIRDYRDELLDLNEQLDEIREEVEEKLMEAFDAWQEKLEKGIDTIDHYGSVLESYKNIIDIVGTDTLGLSDEFMNNLSQGSVDNAINKLEAAKAEYHAVESARAEAEKKLDEARASGDTKSAEMWESTLEDLTEKSQEAQENMLSAWEDALSKVAEQFEQSVERIVDNFNKSVYKLGGLEGLSNDFAKEQERSDMMLDDYEKIYELSKLSRDINKSIDDTDLIGGKQKLKKLLGEVNALQEDGVEMSQYDLEYLQKTYDLRLAELELEEAQRAKNTVRLSKDNEGNWSYVYTQNTDAVDAAQQKYEDALYAMQDLSSNYIDEMSEKLIETSQEMAEALAELRVEDFASIDEYYAKVDEIQTSYQEQMKTQEEELNKAIANNKTLYEEDWTAYSEATGYKITDTANFVTAFKDSIFGNLMDSDSDTANFTDLIASSVSTMTEQLLAAANTYYENLANAMEAADTTVESFGEDAAAAIDEVVAKSDEGATAVEDMADRMNTAVNDVMSNIQTWQQTYGAMMGQIVNDNLKVIESINDLVAALSLDDFDASVSWSFTPRSSSEEEGSSFDTGGYTGSWGKEGKLAVLHEKELVLNANDTANMLDALRLTQELLEMIDLQAQTAKLGFGNLVATTLKDSQRETLEQKVEITAEFPNVTDHNEIEEALMNLTNTASQYANRK